jgi:hypothetical protein
MEKWALWHCILNNKKGKTSIGNTLCVSLLVKMERDTIWLTCLKIKQAQIKISSSSQKKNYWAKESF